MGRKDSQVALRIEREYLERADVLVPKLERIPEMAAVRVSRAAVLRLAIIRGIAFLESEYSSPNES